MRKLMHLFLLFLFLVLQVQLWTGKGSIAEAVASQRQIEEQQRENERLYRRNRLLSVEVVELQNGLITLEEHARLDLGMVGRDETFYLIYD
ncbi:cell division protein FtsB [Endozoicomonas sp. OPT23]|uniref:septum formation initiator family protein n=1 Tax=Endozoicomonas sp. OPT23 TaxID=2072845 RepID=UPI00129BF27C|nr:septum formation initiator family protein [Endozoicomonas sp. OPT23]MRI34936.1 cell division protein FtsB [Endozoicomonas sp. OPT23]